MIEFKDQVDYYKELEIAVLGICLLEPGATGKITAIITPAMFYVRSHGIVWEVLQQMHSTLQPIDLLTVTHHFRKSKQLDHLEQYEVAPYLVRLTTHVVSSTHLLTWARIIKSMWQHRETIIAASTGVPDGGINAMQARLKHIKNPTGSARPSRKLYRWLLGFVSKPLIKSTIYRYGNKTILGTGPVKIKVDSVILVYIMSLIAPEHTWTTGNVCDQVWTTDKCKEYIQPESYLDEIKGQRLWINKSHNYPANW